VKVEVSYKLWGKVQVEVAVPDYDAVKEAIDAQVTDQQLHNGVYAYTYSPLQETKVMNSDTIDIAKLTIYWGQMEMMTDGIYR
jgi:hypothetical protein